MSDRTGELFFYETSAGRWAWCYREGGDRFELHSNQDHATREDAVATARQAYPDAALAPVVGRYPEAEANEKAPGPS